MIDSVCDRKYIKYIIDNMHIIWSSKSKRNHEINDW